MMDIRQEYRLQLLGLKQEFKRAFDFQASFSLSFIIMQPLAGIPYGLSFAWIVGGPGAAMWGWLVVSVFTLLTGLAMAEVVSGLPSSGGPFFWSSMLGGQHSGVLSWVTGWCNLFGQIAITAGSSFGAMSNVVAMVQLLSGSSIQPIHQLLIQWGVLLMGGAVSSCRPRRLSHVFAYAAFVNFAGVVVVVLLLPTVAPWHKSAGFVWATFFTKSMSFWNVPNNAYLWVQATVIASNTLAGYDCCSHISEETRGADSQAPLAIVWSIAACAVMGYVLLLGMLLCVQDPNSLLDPNAAAQGYAAAQLVWDVFRARFGSGAGSTLVLGLFWLAGCLGTIASITSNSRMIFAFARSRAIPFSTYFSGISQRTHMPIRTVWLSVILTAALSTLLLVPPGEAFAGVLGYGSACLQISYGVPILCRLTVSRHSFIRGPFNLGQYSKLVGWTAICWIIASMVILLMPASFPVEVATSPIAFGAVLVCSVCAWYCPKIGGRHSYMDPRRQADIAEAMIARRARQFRKFNRNVS